MSFCDITSCTLVVRCDSILKEIFLSSRRKYFLQGIINYIYLQKYLKFIMMLKTKDPNRMVNIIDPYEMAYYELCLGRLFTIHPKWTKVYITKISLRLLSTWLSLTNEIKPCIRWTSQNVHNMKPTTWCLGTKLYSQTEHFWSIVYQLTQRYERIWVILLLSTWLSLTNKIDPCK